LAFTLLQTGRIDLTIRNNDGFTPYELAIELDRVEMVTLLAPYIQAEA